jgi:DNA-binding response OmpR family regulator
LAEQAAVPDNGDIHMDSPKRILVVDDDPAIHEFMNVVLASPELNVEHARDSQDALERIGACRYDLVLADIRISGVNGYDLLRQIHDERPGTKVMVLTADHTPDKILNSLREHAYAYFSKPFSPTALVEAVVRALTTQTEDDDIQVRSALPQWVALDVSCRLDVADRLVQFLSQMKMDLPLMERENVALAFRELLRNAIEHGGKCDPTKKVHVAYLRTSRTILYYIRDPGEGFRFDELPHAAVSNPKDRPDDHVMYRLEHGIRPGGFGILMARNMMDELLYNEQGNELVLIKYL